MIKIDLLPTDFSWSLHHQERGGVPSGPGDVEFCNHMQILIVLSAQHARFDEKRD
jgi:hypothetical protein